MLLDQDFIQLIVPGTHCLDDFLLQQADIGLGYRYDSIGRLASVSYPGGAVVNYVVTVSSPMETVSLVL